MEQKERENTDLFLDAYKETVLTHDKIMGIIDGSFDNVVSDVDGNRGFEKMREEIDEELKCLDKIFVKLMKPREAIQRLEALVDAKSEVIQLQRELLESKNELYKILKNDNEHLKNIIFTRANEESVEEA